MSKESKMKYCIVVLLMVLFVRGNAQSLFYAGDKETFLKQLQDKPVADIRKELADASVELKDLAEQFKRLEKLFDFKNDKTYTEATAKIIPPFTLPDARLVEEQFQATVKALEFEQQFLLPDAEFEIRPPEQKGSRDYLRLNYRIKQLYKDGQSLQEDAVGLKRMDSLQATASYSVPVKMATVKINTGQKTAIYRNAKIYLDAVNKNYVTFRVDTAINDDLLEVYALTPGGKLVDHSGYMNSSNKNDGSIGKFIGQVILFLDGTVKDIDAHKFKDQAAVIAAVEKRLTILQLPEKSAVNYKEYEFNGNVKTLVLYFREDKKTFRKDITAYNKEARSLYNLFTDHSGKEGIADNDGNVVIEAQYTSLHKENDHYYYTEDKDYAQTNYYFDQQARKLVPLKGVDYINDQQDGMVVARRLIRKDTVNYEHEYKYSLYNNKGKQVIPEQYAFLEVAGNVVICRGTQEGKSGLLNLEGKMIAALTYDEITQATDRKTGAVLPVIQVKKEGHYGLLSEEGKLLCPVQYEYVMDFSEGRAVVILSKEEENVYGIVDMDGKLIVPLQYDYISDITDGIAVFGKDKKYGLLDKAGKIIIPAKYSRMGEISDGMIVVRNESDKYGAINNKGEEVIPFKFGEIKDFQAGYAFVFTEKEYGIIDKTGKFMMQAPRPMSYGMSTNWEGKERTYQINDKTYNYKGDLMPDKK
jgi:hypothetical protein